jgi:hypothetical protein
MSLSWQYDGSSGGLLNPAAEADGGCNTRSSCAAYRIVMAAPSSILGVTLRVPVGALNIERLVVGIVLDLLKTEPPAFSQLRKLAARIHR